MGGDRYQNLVRVLRGGGLPARDDTRPLRLEWHPIAFALLRVITVAVVVWALVVGGATLWRELRVDHWTGPDTSVTSGQRLAGCDDRLTFHDPIFPAWVRFEGAVYAGADLSRPVGPGANASYPATGYRLGELELFRVANTPAGQAGDQILLKLETVGVGELYIRVPDC